jgi:DNA-binding NtrC family response regulator
MSTVTIRVDESNPYAKQVRDCKRQIVLNALLAAEGDVIAAAAALRVDRSNLYRLMRSLGISLAGGDRDA